MKYKKNMENVSLLDIINDIVLKGYTLDFSYRFNGLIVRIKNNLNSLERSIPFAEIENLKEKDEILKRIILDIIAKIKNYENGNLL